MSAARSPRGNRTRNDATASRANIDAEYTGIAAHGRASETKANGYLGRIDKLYGVPVTTRNWNTVMAVRIAAGA